MKIKIVLEPDPLPMTKRIRREMKRPKQKRRRKEAARTVWIDTTEM